ncbi:MAG TPA: type II toxin-antitoxin system RelE/ParE family toxin [Planctomycetaceae bacterium]|nr:type II toxin-antitoxin system RelE/ParE family toxin [Planctomycetaceae bacterium]
MSRRILPEADGEAIAAALWYDDRRAGLGDDFLAEFEQSLGQISRNPQQLPRLEDYAGPHDIRRCRLRRFPYTVIVCVRDEETSIVAVAHARRRPLFWLERLQ